MPTQNSTYTGIHLEPDEILHITKVYKEEYGSFTMIGRLRQMPETTDETHLDVFDRQGKLGKGALNLWLILKSGINYVDNLTYYNTENFTKSQKVMHSRALSELKRWQMVKKAVTTNKAKHIGNHMYMVNPNFILCKKQNDAISMWNLLK